MSVRSIMSQLMTSEAQEILGKLGTPMTIDDSPDCVLVDTNQKGTQTEPTNNTVDKRNVETQTEPWHTGQAESIKSIRGIESFEEWEIAAQREWDEAVYRKTEVIRGNPVKTKNNVTKVLMVDKSQEDNTETIIKLFKERFPELEEVEEDFEILEEITNRRASGQLQETRRKVIKFDYDGSTMDLWNKLNRVKLETPTDEHIALHQLRGISTPQLRKMAEAIFMDANPLLTIYTPQETTGKEKRPAKDTYALVVGEKGQNYKEVLEKVKDKFRDRPETNKIKGLRSTRDGRLLITTERNLETLKILSEIVQGETQELKVHQFAERLDQKKVFVRGIDATMTQEDVKCAIQDNLGLEKPPPVSNLRPGPNDTQTAIVTLVSKDIEKIHRQGLRIGIANCEIQQKVDLPKCRKCWQHDHVAPQCTGPDRSALCFKCGKEGHVGKECTENEFCPICEEGGHMAGRGKCKEFKRALTKIKQNTQYPNV
ncbi:uncharacterized protein [Leptinotarsa decemlineata]|uniref:uncharacterized protein n=1 Tax=Leptinotarsa decemlineata TaxID=7539 RepID=UPI003D30961A